MEMAICFSIGQIISDPQGRRCEAALHIGFNHSEGGSGSDEEC